MERKIGTSIFLMVILLLIVSCGKGGGSQGKAQSGKGGSVVSGEYSPADPNSSTPVKISITAIADKEPEYRWTVNGVPAGKSRRVLSPENFRRGDTVFCSIFIDDQKKKKIGPIIIKNSPPVLQSVSIEPDEPKRGTDISINIRTFDADDDEIEPVVRWFKNGEKTGEGRTLSGNSFSSGDRIYAEVIPFDGFDRGKGVTTEKIMVQNTPPEITSGVPSVSGRKLNYEVKTRDVDGDTVTISLEEGPSGMSLEGNKLIWEAPEVEKDTSFKVKLLAEDNHGGRGELSFDLTLGRKKEE